MLGRRFALLFAAALLVAACRTPTGGRVPAGAPTPAVGADQAALIGVDGGGLVDKPIEAHTFGAKTTPKRPPPGRPTVIDVPSAAASTAPTAGPTAGPTASPSPAPSATPAAACEPVLDVPASSAFERGHVAFSVRAARGYDPDVTWKATGGALRDDEGTAVLWDPPLGDGTFTITATAVDGAQTTVVRWTVSQKAGVPEVSEVALVSCK